MGNNYEIIEQYCNGDLDEAEKTDFETKLKIDSELSEQVQLYKAAVMPLARKFKNEQATNELKNTLKNIEGKYFREKKSEKIIPMKKYIIGAVSIAAMAVLAFFIFSPRESLYEQYAVHEPVEVTTRSGNDYEESLRLGLDDFNNKAYKEAVLPLEKYVGQHPEKLQIKFTLGIAYLETDDIEKAMEIFKGEDISDSSFRDKALWYMALVYLKQEKNSECKKELEKISINSPYYYERAQELKNEIDN